MTRCLRRFVIESLGEVIVSKLIFGAFVAPMLLAVKSLPWAVKAQQWAMQHLPCRPDYSPKPNLLLELAFVSSVLDDVLVLGAAMPAVIFLGCIAIASRLATVHMVPTQLQLKFQNDYAAPNSWPSIAHLMIGTGLQLWFWLDNADQVRGTQIVYAGAPLALLAGWGRQWAWQWWSRRTGTPTGDTTTNPRNRWHEACRAEIGRASV